MAPIPPNRPEDGSRAMKGGSSLFQPKGQERLISTKNLHRKALTYSWCTDSSEKKKRQRKTQQRGKIMVRLCKLSSLDGVKDAWSKEKQPIFGRSFIFHTNSLKVHEAWWMCLLMYWNLFIEIWIRKRVLPPAYWGNLIAERN